MQASVPGEIRWRVDLYTKCFDFCRDGRFAFARFLALVPDRLRLVTGKTAAHLSIPVSIASQLEDVWQHALTDAQPPGRRPDQAELRRVLRLCQLDPDLDPLWTLGWVRRSADPLLKSISLVYRQGLSEVGRGEGGEERAYLSHLLILAFLGRTQELDAPPERRLLLMAMVSLALQGLLETDLLPVERLSARLGFLFSLTDTPFAFGVDERIAQKPINHYRTIPGAVQLARRVIQDPIEVIPLARTVQIIQRRLLADPELERSLTRDLLLDRVRDAALLSLLTHPDDKTDLSLLHEVCSSERGLIQHVQNERRRRALSSLLKSHPARKATDALQRLLEAADTILAGDRTALGVHGNLEERAGLAAAGAVALVLDAHTHQLQRSLNARIQAMPETAWERGAAYRISADGEPLYRLPQRQHEAELFVDTSELAMAATEQDAEAAGHLLWRGLLEPALAAAERHRGEASAHVLECTHLGLDGLCFSGDVVAILALAAEIDGVTERLRAQLAQATPDILGGASTRHAEIDREKGELAARRDRLQAALRRTTEEPDGHALLQDELRMVEKQLAHIEQLATETAPPVVRVSSYVAYGPIAPRFPLPDHIGVDRLTLSAHQKNRHLGTRRPEWIGQRRSAALAAARAVRGPSVVWLGRATIDQREGESALYSEGILVSDEAVSAWFKAKTPAVRKVAREIEVQLLPEDGRHQFIFDREVETFLLGRATDRDQVLRVFRQVGRLSGRPVWELIRPDSDAGLFVCGTASADDSASK